MAKKVLVVDDEPEIRDLCRVNLEFAGHDVVLAGGGREAIDYLARERPDFVFLDLMMPEVDGWEVLKQLRIRKSTSDVPVVLLTARAADEDQIRAWEEGVFDYIVKPFNPLSLAEWVEQAYDPAAEGIAEHRRHQALEQLRFLQNLR